MNVSKSWTQFLGIVLVAGSVMISQQAFSQFNRGQGNSGGPGQFQDNNGRSSDGRDDRDDDRRGGFQGGGFRGGPIHGGPGGFPGHGGGSGGPGHGGPGGGWGPGPGHGGGWGPGGGFPQFQWVRIGFTGTPAYSDPSQTSGIPNCDSDVAPSGRSCYNPGALCYIHDGWWWNNAIQQNQFNLFRCGQ